MSFKTVSAILRGGWLLDKAWADAHLPVVLSVLKGSGTFSAFFDDEQDEDRELAKVPQRVVSAGVVYKVGYWTDLTRIPEGSIAMIDITGPIMKYGGMCSYGSMDKATMIQRADNAPNIKGIILNIDSPGGQVAGTTDLADTVKGTKKPIIGMINDGIAASAAMWVGSATDELYVTKKTDQVGSVGVYTTLYDYNAYLEKEGLKVHEIYAPQSKDKNADYREALKGNYEAMQADLKLIADEFISTVSANRKGKLTSDEWKTGKMFYAKDAVRIGLVDGLKSFDQVIKRMDQIINSSQNSTSNKMSVFQKSLKAAKAESFAVVDGGFLLEESHLDAIEAHIDAAETVATTTATELTAATNRATQAEASLTTANETIATNKTRISELEAQVTKLQKQPSSEFSSTATDKDKPAQEQGNKKSKYHMAIDDEAAQYR